MQAGPGVAQRQKLKGDTSHRLQFTLQQREYNQSTID